MEAIAAFALAGNVLQFIDFSLKVLSQGNALKRSADGTLKEHSELEVVVKHLDKLMGQLDTTDKELEPLILKCKDVGVELKEALAKVMRRNDKSVWSNYRAALLAVWKKSTLEEVEKRLDRLRQEIGLHVQVTSRRAIADLSTHLSTTEVHAEKAASGVVALSDAQKSNFVQLQDNARTITDSILSNSSSVEGLAAEVADLRKLCEETKSRTRPQPGGSSSETPPESRSFLETLKFRGMNDREETIPIAHVRTFEWLFMDPNSYDGSDKNMSRYQQERKDLRKSLKDKLHSIGVKQEKMKQVLPPDTGNKNSGFALQKWLRSGRGIYWIWGKPGCGKSTLMKACGQEKKPKLRRRLEKLLREWSSGHGLLVAKFFFFRPGSSLQKSHLGLLQSILYQLLSQKPSLINRAFTEREQLEAIARSTRATGTDASVWSVQELVVAFRNIRDPEVKIFLHIDGIDEMDGSANEIADILCNIATTNTNIKILTAGRWTPEFEKAFGIENSLNLHETTELDILHYTVDNLLQEDMLQLLSASDNLTTDNLTADKFTIVLEEIISAPQGVFLWVKIVVDSLLQGVNRFENFDQLHSRLREYPNDLDKLYWFLFESIDSRYSQDAAFWLLAVYKYHGADVNDQVSVVELSAAERFDLRNCQALDQIYEATKVPMTQRATSMIKRMRAQCPHFFEFRPPSAIDKRVGFSHRTVLDFLSQNSVSKGLQIRIPANRDPHQGLLAARLADLWRCCKRESRNSESQSLYYLMVWGLICDIGTQKCNFLWNQLVSHAKRSCWPFQKDHDAVKLKIPVPSNMDTDEECGFTPTVRGWYNESEWGRLKRILCIYPNPVTYLHVSGCVVPPHLQRQFQHLQPIPHDQHLSRDERMDVLMLHLIRPFNPCCEGCEYLNSNALNRFRHMERVLFPSSFDPNDTLWPRILECIRVSIIYIPLYEKYPPKLARTSSALPDSMTIAARLVDVMIELIGRGANPNALCRSIWRDPDKSLLSALSLFLRLHEALQVAVEAEKFEKYYRREMIRRVEKVLRHLREAGGREMVVPSGDHNEEEVKLLTFKYTDTGECSSPIEQWEEIIAEQNCMELEKSDTEHGEE